MEDSQGGTKGVCREIGRKKVVRKEYREGSLEIKCVRWMQKKGETHLSRRHGWLKNVLGEHSFLYNPLYLLLCLPSWMVHLWSPQAWTLYLLLIISSRAALQDFLSVPSRPKIKIQSLDCCETNPLPSPVAYSSPPLPSFDSPTFPSSDNIKTINWTEQWMFTLLILNLDYL